ncbi:MAG: hypothetical protein HYX53_05290 [Chloroflexi bacterium]|nr:hypothetical protein [Chloroflexota bacterium]
MTRTPKLLSIGAGLASVAGIVGGLVAVQAGSATAASNSDVTNMASAAAPAAATAAREDYLQKLAANLGIDEATLKAALQKTSLDEVSAQLAAGTITQAQADDITARINSGDDFFFGLAGGMGGPRGMGGDHDGRGFGADSAALATFFGTDEATLRADLQAGKSLADIGTGFGKSRDELKAFLTSANATELAADVASGKLTQTQADQRAADFASRLDAMIDGQFGGGIGRGPGGPHQDDGSRSTATPASGS